jgi:hypothetical protein
VFSAKIFSRNKCYSTVKHRADGFRHCYSTVKHRADGFRHSVNHNLLALAHIQLITQTSKLLRLRLGSSSNTRKLGVAHAYDPQYVPDKELESGSHFLKTCSFIITKKVLN